MTAAELEVLIDGGSEKDVLGATRGLAEKDRRALAATAVKRAKHHAREENAAVQAYWADPRRPDQPARDREVRHRDRLDVACAAMLALCSPTDLAILHSRALWDRQRAFAVLSERRPPWLAAWGAKLVADDVRFWDLCYMLVYADLTDRPSCESWCLGFLRDVSGPKTHLADPMFVEKEFWRLFEIDGTTELSFANVDRWGGDVWKKALLARSREPGSGVPRPRLLDAALDALGRDFIQYRARWFADLHRALEPTPSERRQRADRYLALLGSAIPPTVTFALEELRALEDAGDLPAAALLARLGSVAQARTKKSALAALAMAERAAAREPALAGAAATVAAAALAHEATDVQARAIALVVRFADQADAGFVAQVRELAPGTAATLRPKLLAWLKAAAPSESTTGELPPTPPSGTTGTAASVASSEPLASERGTAPPSEASPQRRAASLGEALDLLSGAIERFEAPGELEAALEGVARFCGERPPDFAARTGPLAKRAPRSLIA